MKWLFTDFDGTLKNSKDGTNRIAEEDIFFVNSWQSKGNKLVIATGRPFEHISNHINENYSFHPDYYITNAGDGIYDNHGKQLFLSHLDNHTKKVVIEFVKNNREHISSFVYSFKGEENFFYHDQWDEGFKEIFMQMYPTEHPFAYIDGKQIICFKLGTNQEIWKKLVKTLKIEKCPISYVSNNLKQITFSEIHHKNSSKGNAIKILAKKLNIGLDDIIVVGDDNNDLSMFEAFKKNSYIVKQTHNEEFRDKANFVIEAISDIPLD